MAADTDSPINMKRFICKVVDKIDCKIVDLAGLMGFIPYYSGHHPENPKQSYAALEIELMTKCHMGGQWIEPKETPAEEAEESMAGESTAEESTAGESTAEELRQVNIRRAHRQMWR